MSKTTVRKKSKRMTKKQKELNSEAIMKLAENKHLSITQATLEFAKDHEIKPERILSRVSQQIIEKIKEETKLDETKYYLHKHLPKKGTLED